MEQKFGVDASQSASRPPVASSRPPLVLLAGPTATGKTELSVELAHRLDGEIVSADSMQVYRGCVIGSAQPTAEELRGIPCHLVGCVGPSETWTVADWLKAAQEKIAGIHGRGRAALVVGGTGLYFKTLTAGLFESPGAGRRPEIRERLEREWVEDDGAALRARLAEVDPEALRRIHPNDKLRVVRALEIYESSGRPMTKLQEESRRGREPLTAHRFVLCRPRDELYRRIDERVVRMVRRGFPEEVRELLAEGARPGWPAMRAIGYRQMVECVQGRRSREEAIAETQRLSRKYAKQQFVLYRKWPGAIWLEVSRGMQKNADAIEKYLEFSPYPGF